MAYAPSQLPWLAPYAMPLGVTLLISGLSLVMWGSFHPHVESWFASKTPPEGTKVEPRLTVPSNTGAENSPKLQRIPDVSKVALIDELYPLLYDLSETDVDAFGNATGDWQRAFLDGEAKEFFDKMNHEIRLLVGEYEPIKAIAAKHSQHRDIHRLVEGVADYLNRPGEAMRAVREKAEALEYRFSESSLALVKADVVAMQRAIGDLRQYLSRELLPRLADMREAAS